MAAVPGLPLEALTLQDENNGSVLPLTPLPTAQVTILPSPWSAKVPSPGVENTIPASPLAPTTESASVWPVASSTIPATPPILPSTPNTSGHTTPGPGDVMTEMEDLMHQALNCTKDRPMLEKLVAQLDILFADDTKTDVTVPALQNPYQRLIIHKVGDIYKLGHTKDSVDMNTIVLTKIPGISANTNFIKDLMATIAPPTSNVPESTAPVNVKKIMQREKKEKKKKQRQTSSSSQETTDLDTSGSSPKQAIEILPSKTLKEREEEYERVKARIAAQVDSKAVVNTVTPPKEKPKHQQQQQQLQQQQQQIPRHLPRGALGGNYSTLDSAEPSSVWASSAGASGAYMANNGLRMNEQWSRAQYAVNPAGLGYAGEPNVYFPAGYGQMSANPGNFGPGRPPVYRAGNPGSGGQMTSPSGPGQSRGEAYPNTMTPGVTGAGTGRLGPRQISGSNVALNGGNVPAHSYYHPGNGAHTSGANLAHPGILPTSMSGGYPGMPGPQGYPGSHPQQHQQQLYMQQYAGYMQGYPGANAGGYHPGMNMSGLQPPVYMPAMPGPGQQPSNRGYHPDQRRVSPGKTSSTETYTSAKDLYTPASFQHLLQQQQLQQQQQQHVANPH